MSHHETFAPSNPAPKHLYSREALVGHRRTMSNNGERLEAFQGVRKGHRRTFSNNAAELQVILTPAQARNQAKAVIEEGKSGEESTERGAKVSLQQQGKGGFLGVLDAAILYFHGDSSPTASVAYAQGVSREDYSEISSVVAELKGKVHVLEAENEALRIETKRLAAQRENYASHIGALNTKMLDLQLALTEERKRSIRAKITPIDLSQNKVQVRSLDPSPRDSPLNRSKGKPPTPAKTNKPLKAQ